MAITLPVYELTINEKEDSFVSAIALVETPAIERNFLAFKKHQDFKFKQNDDKMELYGPAMIPDTYIYRRGENGFEYNVYFTVDTIKQIEQVFFKRKNQSNINIEHNNSLSADSYVFSSYIIDKKAGLAPTEFSDLPDGTWIVRVKVTNPQIWADIKAGKRQGFSVEGLFQLTQSAGFNNQFHTNTSNDEAEVLAMIDQLTGLLKNK